MKYLRQLGPRWLGLAAYVTAALLWYYAAVTFLDSYLAVCKLYRQPFPVEMAAWNFLVWIAPLLITRSKVAVWINNAFGFVILGAAILFAISSHNAPECLTANAPSIGSSGWFEFDSVSDLSMLVCYATTIVDLLRWKFSKAKDASKSDR